MQSFPKVHDHELGWHDLQKDLRKWTIMITNLSARFTEGFKKIDCY
jgi:hypothetical protein